MRLVSPLRRRGLRLRLTLAYSGLFLLAGVVLVSVTYGLLAQSLSEAPYRPAPSPSVNPSLCQSLADHVARDKCLAAANSTAQDVAKSTAVAQRSQTLGHLLSNSVITLVLLVVLSGALGWVMAGRALRPVHAITAAARRASGENLAESISLGGPDDELKELADTFDDMLARLEAAFASQRRFVANASHELRTPLTVMRTAIDVTLAKPDQTPAQLRAMAVEVRQAADQAEALIEALLTLARSDRGITAREPFDLSVLAEDALDACRRDVAGRLTVETVLDPAPAAGDPRLAGRLVTNLIDNAIRHNTENGWISVRTGTTPHGRAYIEIVNDGPRIAAEAVPGLFEPFRRLSERSGTPAGTGLGLSIVQSVVLAHHGSVRAKARTEGGLDIRVELPLRRLDIVGDGAEHGSDLLRFLPVGVLAATVCVRHRVEQLDQVLDDDDHLVRLLLRLLGRRGDTRHRIE